MVEQNESVLVPYVILDHDSSSDSGTENVTLSSAMISFVSLNYNTPTMIVVASLLTIVIGATMFGNLLVGLALFRFRSLRTVSNFLIGNLALSDFLLATAVLPLSTANECLGHWVFGRVACNVWLLVDVLCCTASLWNICIIALDRFTATLYPIWYRERRSSHQALLYVAVVWTLSTAVCVPPLLGWNDLAGNYVRDNATNVYHCILFQSPSYVLYSASGSFFVPFFVPFFLTVFLYVQIFIVLRKRMKKMRHATGANKIKSQKPPRATLTTAQYTSRQNETSTLLPVETAVDNGSNRAITSIEMTEFNDGTLVEECTSLKSICSAYKQEDVVRKKMVRVTDTIVERVASVEHLCDVTPANHATATSSNVSTKAVDCRSCFVCGRTTAEDSSDDTIVVSSSNRHHSEPTQERGDIDDADDIRSNLMSNVDTSIRTGVSKTPQVAAVIAMAGRRGRRRLGELFVRMSSTVNAERVARVASAARRLEQREIQATIRMAIIITFFCCMWLGFFTVYVINSWCPSNVCSVPRALDAFFFWLGYSNSGINPILYTIFNDDFRCAFRKLLGCGGVDASGRGGDRRGGRETTMMRSGRL